MPSPPPPLECRGDCLRTAAARTRVETPNDVPAFDDSLCAQSAANLIAELSLVAIERDELVAQELIRLRGRTRSIEVGSSARAEK